MTAAPRILEALDTVEAALVQASVPGISLWWRSTWRRFYSHESATVLAGCVGRGGDKTRESVIAGCAETLAGDFHIPPGERHYFVHVAENVAEASKTLSMYEQYLRLLGIRFSRAGDTIELEGMPRGIRVLACRVGAVSGYRCFGWTADECAKWSNDGVDPSEEVIASIKAMTVTHRGARGRMISSPLAMAGYFYDVWSAGDTDATVAVRAASWESNPSITEAQTRKLERDERKWSREYAAIPQAGALAAFDVRQVDRAMRTTVPADWKICTPVILVDPSAGGSDSFAWTAARWRKQPAGEQAVLEFLDVDSIAGAAEQGVTSTELVRRIAELARRHNASAIHADQFERYALEAAFQARGFRYTAHPWTNELKSRAVEHVRGWLRDGLLVLPNHDRLRSELLAFEERITASGALTFKGRGSTHDDHCMLVLLCAVVDIEGGLSGSPSGKPMAGENLFRFYEEEFMRAQGKAPTPLVVRPEPTVLRVPPPIPPFGTYLSRGGHSYSVVDGQITVTDADDLADLQTLNFKVE